MITLVKCKFCLRNGSDYVEIPEGQPVRCQYCKRVQPLTEKQVERREGPSLPIPDYVNLFK